MKRQMRMIALLVGLTLIAPRLSWGEAYTAIEKRFIPLLEQARTIRDKEEQTQSVAGIGKMMCQSFPKEPGVRVLQEALTLSRAIASPLARSMQQYWIAVSLAGECGEIDEAIGIARGIDDLNQRVNALQAIEKIQKEAEKESINVVRPEEEEMRRTLEQAPPFLVTVENVDGEGSVKSFAHGFIADPRGYVLTNAHLDKGGNIRVMHLGKEYSADIVKRLGSSDILLLRLQKVARSLPAATLPDRPELIQNDTVVGTVCGPVGGVRKRVGIFEKSLNGGQAFSADFQSDGIEQGCSGAPLLNLKREVVGMVYGVSPNDRFGFAKPSTELRKILEKALK
ncbi:MAG: trypsin-like peptidase domain-containing protein [candidate division NC10 bacterium]|nr:trypsin-like peptidase domain-containing protein [candidate division NC10 bacterium]MDE2321037.1 trypsin-like peptidase domain-containing protein [candidate division NC10 bacterium]